MSQTCGDVTVNLTQAILGSSNNNNNNESSSCDSRVAHTTVTRTAASCASSSSPTSCNDLFALFYGSNDDDSSTATRAGRRNGDNDGDDVDQGGVVCRVREPYNNCTHEQAQKQQQQQQQHMTLHSQHGVQPTPYSAVALPVSSPQHTSTSPHVHKDDDEADDDAEALCSDDKDADSLTSHDSTTPRSSSSLTLPRLSSASSLVCDAQQQQQPPASPASAHRRSVSLVSLHSARYGAFLRAYLGLTSDSEVARACRRARTMCAIGVRKLRVRSTNGSNNSSSSSSGATTATIAAAAAAAGVTGSVVVRTTQSFRRHSILAVEGDAVFAELLMQAYAQRARCQASAAMAVAAAAVAPNARCIVLHYGLPDTATATDNKSSSSSSCDGGGGAGTLCARASLLAVVCSTRVEAQTNIHVCLASYVRCLDEAAWHRQRYGTHHDSSSSSSSRATACTQDESDEVVYNGVRRFALWPRDVVFYHGVGARHASTAWCSCNSNNNNSNNSSDKDTCPCRAGACAAFPFTLVDLLPTPELGAGQLGLVTTRVVPYATCFLYTGPTWTTTQLDKLRAAAASDTRSPPQPTSRAQHAHARSDAADDRDADATRAALDDTYALGLGQHEVCFGQGLARYINHRYNLTRFGNCELCSLMLSVTNDATTTTRCDGRTVAVAAAAAARRRAVPRNRRASGCGVAVKESARQCGRLVGNSGKSSSNSNKTKSNAAARAVYELSRRRSRLGDLMDASDDATCARQARQQQPASVHNNNSNNTRATTQCTSATAATATTRRRMSRRVYYEQHSRLITLPFFLTTTDVPAGAALLAWTYGEDYDARLERTAVAHDALVSYDDAVVLNRRLAQPPSSHDVKTEVTDDDDAYSHARQRCPAAAAAVLPSTASARVCVPLPRPLQRYHGDYRYAIAVGDIVWRRRIVYASSPHDTDSSSNSNSTDCTWRHTITRRVCNAPERDLFVVVDCMRCGVEYVLLRPLRRLRVTHEELRSMLPAHLLQLPPSQQQQQQQQPHVECGRSDNVYNSATHGVKTETSLVYEKNGDDDDKTRAACVTELLLSSWAVYEVQHTPLVATAASSSSSSSSSNNSNNNDVLAEQLRRCVVATTSSTALLLSGTDYHYVNTTSAATTASTTRRRKQQGSTSVSSPSSLLSPQQPTSMTCSRALCVAVDVAKLRASTALVCCTRDAVSSTGSSSSSSNKHDTTSLPPPLSNGVMWPLFRNAAAPSLRRLFA